MGGGGKIRKFTILKLLFLQVLMNENEEEAGILQQQEEEGIIQV